MSNSNGMDDFFGRMPTRPSHPDFWKLSEIVLGLDGAMQDAMRAEGMSAEEVISREAAKLGDSYSVTYMATQRAMRVHGANTVGEVNAKVDDIARTAMVYLEGMLVGASLQRSREEA